MSIHNLQDFKIKKMVDRHDDYRVAAALIAVEDSNKEMEKRYSEANAYLEYELREVFK
jgi:hypothetical protein